MMERVKTPSSWECMEPLGKRSSSRLGIYSNEEFRRILRYERVRSERERCGFSLAVFELDKCGNGYRNSGPTRPEALVARLRYTVRLTDHVGWYGYQNVAVLLPGATEDEANRFRERLANRMSPDLLHVPVRVYHYRNGWVDRFPQRSYDISSRDKLSFGQGGASASGSDLGTVLSRKMPFWKRALDVSVSVIMLLVLAPIFLGVGLFILLSSPGPVIFRQKRVGHGGKTFCLYKFRTMVNHPDEGLHSEHAGRFISNGEIAMTKLDELDPRIIHGGRILRKMALDELPQLFNVLNGDMSLVGPRPCIPYEAQIYKRWQTHRFDVLPGITGPWQVNGKNDLSFRRMMCLDINYCRTMSLGLDLKLLLATIPAVADQVRAAVKKRIDAP